MTPMTPLLIRSIAVAGGLLAVLTAAGSCGDVNAVLEGQSQARDLAADLEIQFTRAVDAANRAVMSNADDASAQFAHEAEQAKAAAQRDVDSLMPILQKFHDADEAKLLQEFVDRFAKYQTLDRQILDAAVENTNVKAQRLSFGEGQAAAADFAAAVNSVKPASASDVWRVRALAASALSSLRAIEVLEGPHIADPDDASMTQTENRMAEEERSLRAAVKELQTIAAPSSRAKIADASSALDRFMSVHTQILALSRKNTNVRSLALSLDQKRALIEPCEKSLRALRDALAKRKYPAGR